MKYELIVVGGGIVGLATAYQLLEMRPGARLLVLEKESGVGRHQTGNNSGVIHSGLYYKPGSLKAAICREGYQRLLDFCQRENIAHDICGKIVVATTPRELPELEELYRRGIANGLDGLRYLTPEEIREIEPHCVGIRGLWVPQTGIVDYSTVAKRYAELILLRGGEIELGVQVEKIVRTHGGIEVAGTNRTWVADKLVTCGGLHSDHLALLTEPELPIRITPFRGEYYLLKPEARHLVRNLIYPVPNLAFPFLGVHFTRKINDSVECGPNAVLAFGREAYRKSNFNLRDTLETLAWPGFQKIAFKYWNVGLSEFYRSCSKTAFTRSLQRLVPELQSSDLLPGGAGIRAQACDRNGTLLDDFEIRADNNIVHVCNAPSPGATASLAIGKRIAQTLL